MIPLRSTIVDVDLDAVAANCRAIAARANAEVIAVVKADAYGHGAEAVSRALMDAGAAMLAVFTVEEGVVLRRALGGADILVLLGARDRSEIASALDAGLSLVVWDEANAAEVASAARGAGISVRAHFKVDTGLTRLGAPLAEAASRYRAIHALRGIELDGVFSHLANADEPDDTFSPTQIERFRAFLADIGTPPRWVHLSATAGVESLGALDVSTAVRAGLGLYGLHTAPHLARGLELAPALRWRSAVERTTRVPAGTGVSYGHEYRAPRETTIATVPVGYGDGLPRAGTGAVSLLVGGAFSPVAGRVCMDLVMLDVGDGEVRAGDEVVIIGEQRGARQTAEDIAAACRTINYEIVTGIKPRVPRRYLRGDRVVATKTLAGGFRWS